MPKELTITADDYLMSPMIYLPGNAHTPFLVRSSLPSAIFQLVKKARESHLKWFANIALELAG